MDKSLAELWESFRRGLIDRREFTKKVLLTTGGIAAASEFAGLTQEIHAAQRGDITIEEGTYPSPDGDVSYYLGQTQSRRAVSHDDRDPRDLWTL